MFMLEPTDLCDREIASELKREVVEELGDEAELDGTTVDALVRGILSLFQSAGLGPPSRSEAARMGEVDCATTNGNRPSHPIAWPRIESAPD